MFFVDNAAIDGRYRTLYSWLAEVGGERVVSDGVFEVLGQAPVEIPSSVTVKVQALVGDTWILRYHWQAS